MVEMGKHPSYHMVYRLLKLVLVLPIMTTTAKRYFFGIKLLKIDLRNNIYDGLEKEALVKVKIEDIMHQFQKNMYA